MMIKMLDLRNLFHRIILRSMNLHSPCRAFYSCGSLLVACRSRSSGTSNGLP